MRYSTRSTAQLEREAAEAAAAAAEEALAAQEEKLGAEWLVEEVLDERPMNKTNRGAGHTTCLRCGLAAVPEREIERDVSMTLLSPWR